MSVSVCNAPRKVHLVINCYNERWAAQSLLMFVLLLFQAEVNIATWMSDSALQNWEVSPLQSNLALSEVIKTKSAQQEQGWRGIWQYIVVTAIILSYSWWKLFTADQNPLSSSSGHRPIQPRDCVFWSPLRQGVAAGLNSQKQSGSVSDAYGTRIICLKRNRCLQPGLSYTSPCAQDLPRPCWWGQGSFWGISRGTGWEKHEHPKAGAEQNRPGPALLTQDCRGWGQQTSMFSSPLSFWIS